MSKQTSKLLIRVHSWVRRRAVGCLLKQTFEVILLLSFVPSVRSLVTSLLERKIEYILVSFSMRTESFPGLLPPMFDCFSEQIPRFELLYTVFERTSVLSL